MVYVQRDPSSQELGTKWNKAAFRHFVGRLRQWRFCSVNDSETLAAGNAHSWIGSSVCFARWPQAHSGRCPGKIEQWLNPTDSRAFIELAESRRGHIWFPACWVSVHLSWVEFSRKSQKWVPWGISEKNRRCQIRVALFCCSGSASDLSNGIQTWKACLMSC